MDQPRRPDICMFRWERHDFDGVFWVCTKEIGHTGRHEASDAHGTVLASETQTELDREVFPEQTPLVATFDVRPSNRMASPTATQSGQPSGAPGVVEGPLTLQLLALDNLTTRKNEGYAGADPVDPWSNYRSAEAFGLSALDSAILRFAEKHNRIAILYSKRGLDRVGEGMRETLMDAAAIALIAVALLDEAASESMASHDYEPNEPALRKQADTFG